MIFNMGLCGAFRRILASAILSRPKMSFADSVPCFTQHPRSLAVRSNIGLIAPHMTIAEFISLERTAELLHQFTARYPREPFAAIQSHTLFRTMTSTSRGFLRFPWTVEAQTDHQPAAPVAVWETVRFSEVNPAQRQTAVGRLPILGL